jgi:hypothetical protein
MGPYNKNYGPMPTILDVQGWRFHFYSNEAMSRCTFTR